jgi:hypothetical protein
VSILLPKGLKLDKKKEDKKTEFFKIIPILESQKDNNNYTFLVKYNNTFNKHNIVVDHV